MTEIQKGERVRCWPGSINGRSYLAEVISDGVVEFGGQRCYRVRADVGVTDYIAATHVRALTDYQLGQRVRFTNPMYRALRDRGTPNVMKAWIPRTDLPEQEGVIIGKRQLVNGKRYWESGDGEGGWYEFDPKERFTAYLVAYTMHNKPVPVLPEHLTPLEES